MSGASSGGATLPEYVFEWPDGPGNADVTSREWLLTNGLGGYASGTIGHCNTRKYHGLLVPSLDGRGRTVMLARLSEVATVDGNDYRLDGEEHADGTQSSGCLKCLRGFKLHGLIPEWLYEVGGARMERRITMVHGENTVFVSYRHLGGPTLKMRLRPFTVFRPHDGKLQKEISHPVIEIRNERLQIRTREDTPPLWFKLYSNCPTPFVSLSETSPDLCYRIEKARGYEHTERQLSAGYFECVLQPGQTLWLGVTSGDWAVLNRDPVEAFELEQERERRLLERAPKTAQTGVPARLVLAADQFLIDPVTRPSDEAWARAIGQDARSVIAGYHWFTDWGRDTMISLDGLTLATGRKHEAAAILRTFQHYVKDGLLPNLFPEGESHGLYHTADATLWFFHAIHRYVEATADKDLLRSVYATLQNIIDHHLNGTHYNIGVDPDDGLLRQGAEGYQLTWMDAKVDGWVVTPRRGKAVEINALWFNALRLMADWATELGHDARQYAGLSEKVKASFNKKFWNPETKCLFDVVDGENGHDPAVRPNQMFAISLPNPVLRRDKWEDVLEKMRRELVTPVGLRSLSAQHPDYKPKYDGDLRARDAAYHQGTVWAWLIGHYVDAVLKIDPDKNKARALLLGFEAHLGEACIGQVSEVFDATEPYRARGCVAQAWSVAELLRAWLKTV